MENHLYNFYQLTKNTIWMFFLWGLLYYLFDFIYQLVSTYVLDSGLDKNFEDYWNKSFAKILADVIINIIRAFILSIYFYQSTKSIDFVLYIRAWMYGYGILNEFDNMSYLISRSCFNRFSTYESFDEYSDVESQQEIILNEKASETDQEDITNSILE